MRAAGGSAAMTSTTRAELTKPITAAAAMILVEECKVRLDESVDRLLPELADRKVRSGSTGRSTRPCPRSGRSRCATC